MDTHPGALTEQLVLNITKSVLEGLHYLHSRDPPIIHGDLKPNAIFIIERCGSLLVKLGDVDSSRLEAASRNTRRRRAPVYSAPELLRNLSQAFDQKSDMYRYALLFFFMSLSRRGFNVC